jgi:hypothetical protein
MTGTDLLVHPSMRLCAYYIFVPLSDAAESLIIRVQS